MRIAIGVPTLSRHDLLLRLCESITEQSFVPAKVLIVDNSNGTMDLSMSTAMLKVAGIDYEVHHFHNLGVAGSWNYIMDTTKDYDLTVITNDDNKLISEALEEFKKVAEKHPSQNYFTTKTGGFSVFALRPQAMEETGKFDDAYYPAYYEDNDYHYRMKLKGLDFVTTDVEVYEMGVDGQASQTLNGAQTSLEDKRMVEFGSVSNHMRYRRKWGGDPHEETYIVPFNQK